MYYNPLLREDSFLESNLYKDVHLSVLYWSLLIRSCPSPLELARARCFVVRQYPFILYNHIPGISAMYHVISNFWQSQFTRPIITTMLSWKSRSGGICHCCYCLKSSFILDLLLWRQLVWIFHERWELQWNVGKTVFCRVKCHVSIHA